MSRTWPEKWGFEGDLRKCVGKTIEAVDLVGMPYGCVWRTAWAVRFTDGSRAFFVGGVASGVVSPEPEAVHKSGIFTPAEYGELCAAEKAEAERLRQHTLEAKRRELTRLREELGESE